MIQPDQVAYFVQRDRLGIELIGAVRQRPGLGVVEVELAKVCSPHGGG